MYIILQLLIYRHLFKNLLFFGHYYHSSYYWVQNSQLETAQNHFATVVWMLSEKERKLDQIVHARENTKSRARSLIKKK